MANKFFYNRVYNTKRTITNIVIIGVCVIGIIICFIITSNFQGVDKRTPEKTLNIREETSVEVNTKIDKNIFFSKVENVNLDDIEITYPEIFDIKKIGKYSVLINVNGKNYNSVLNVIDTTKPELVVKTVTINETDPYNANSFVTSCIDNSNEKCTIAFYSEGIDQEGNKINYGAFKTPGTYSIKIVAKDSSDNQAVSETKLIINKKNGASSKPKPVTCKYGSNEYDFNTYLLAVDVTSNGCAVNMELYNDDTIAKDINNLMAVETKRIQRDINAMNIKGTFALNRKISAIVNKEEQGIVGYELRITINSSYNNKVETVVDYKVNSDGKRVFISNPYNIAN